MNPVSAFDQLDLAFHQHGPSALLQRLCEQFDQEGRFHERFEGLKLQVRLRLGLPLWSAHPEELEPGPLRDQLEAGLLEACQDVGSRLLQAGRIRDAWSYLRPVGDLASVRRELAHIEPTDENAGELIELYLHEGLDLERGFSLLLKYYGTCNTITTFESSMYGRPREQRAIGARLLVQQLEDELRVRLQDHWSRETDEAWPAGETIRSLLDRHPELMADGAYHIDTTHLASVLRIARSTQDVGSWERARDLSSYGRRLDQSLQYQDQAPFEQLYEVSDRYFATLLGENADEHLDYFRERAEVSDAYHETTYVREVYVDLLSRSGRSQRAWEEGVRLLPAGMQTTGLAPSLLELAAQGGQYAALGTLARERQDRLTYCLALLESPAAGKSRA